MVRKLPDGMEECIIVHTGREGGHACCQGVDQVVPQSLTNATTYVVLHSRMSQRERLMSKERNETESEVQMKLYMKIFMYLQVSCSFLPKTIVYMVC